MAPVNVATSNASTLSFKGRLAARLGKNIVTTTGQVVQPGDARTKLILKKRNQIRDAREKLDELAKQVDAREKLNSRKAGRQEYVNVPVRKVLNTSRIGQIRNTSGQRPRIGLQSKTLLRGNVLVRTVQRTSDRALRQPSENSESRVQVITDRYHPITGNPNVVTIKNPLARKSKYAGSQASDVQTAGTGKQTSQVQQRSLSARVRRPDRVSRTVRSAPVVSQARPRPQYVQRNPRPGMVEARPMRMVASNSYMAQAPRYEDEYVYEVERVPARYVSAKRPAYEYEEYAPVKRQVASMPSSVMSRLDQPKASGPLSGYKVLVTNLHNIVTNEDIEELFGNIGPIASAHLIGKGTAEVVFLNETDAFRSVDVYDNRQLDGQPMNVVKVNKAVVLPSSVAMVARDHVAARNGAVEAQPRGRGVYYT